VGLRTLSIVRHSRNLKTQRLGNWICFRPQVRGGETPSLLGPLERTNLRTETHPVSERLCFLVFRIWDDRQVRKPSNSEKRREVFKR
jgi:hypothetical protein